MPHVQINLDGDGAWKDMAEAAADGTLKRGEIERFTMLEGGMKSGKPSVALLVRLEDGTPVFVETSWAIFWNMANVARARVGEPT